MEQVYDYLRDEIHAGDLAPGKALDLNSISHKLGISKTPLRDALIRLESEGFVTIRPRRGVYVNPVTLEDVRQYYEIIGAMESTALLNVRFEPPFPQLKEMDRLIRKMDGAIHDGDFNLFYRYNLDFHNVYLLQCGNPRLIHLVDMQKRRLYDFPRQPDWIPEWEKRSMEEHRKIVILLEKGDIRGCADFIRDIHWSYEVQEPFIRRYYPLQPGEDR